MIKELLSPWMIYIKAGAAALVLLVIAGTVLKHVAAREAERTRQVAAAYESGTQAERKVWETLRDVERERQELVNRKATAAAMLEVTRLRAQNLTLEKAVEALNHDADKSPDRDRVCLDAGSLLQLDRIR
jgi:predicted Mrr-cat superfamily restriction endonuclease